MQTKLSLYSIFHANLQFSSIPEAHHQNIIDTCYWPLLERCEKFPIHCGLEFSGYTLERIQELDSDCLLKIKTLIHNGKIELIGSGYSQTIFPLVPAEVNVKNLQIGEAIYREFLGVSPVIYYLNEQVFSKSMIDLYSSMGHKTLVFDWNNTVVADHNILDEYKYRVPKMAGVDPEHNVSVLWNNSISFQKLQRYLFQEINDEEYLEYLGKQCSVQANRAFLWYGSDLEIFDCKPGSIDVEYNENPVKVLARLDQIIKVLLVDDRFEFVLPSKIVKTYASNDVLMIDPADYPISCKKQAKYNVSRWSVCGRSNHFLNRECFASYIHMKANNDKNAAHWKQLNYLWSSDNRTFASDKKISRFYELIGVLNKDIGRVPYANVFDISTGKQQFSNEDVESDLVGIKFNPKKGFSIKELHFKNVSPHWLIGTISHDHFDDIRFSTDQFSGHLVTQDIYGKKYADISTSVDDNVACCTDVDGNTNYFAKVNIHSGFEFYKIIKIYKSEAKIDITYHLRCVDFQPQYLRLGILTFNPKAFDLDSLFYATHNGAFEEEKYLLKNKIINQIQTIDGRITSSHCLGATESYLKIGDKDKIIKISYDRESSYVAPLLHFEELNNTYYLRVYHSLAETDETARHCFRGQMKVKLTIEALNRC